MTVPFVTFAYVFGAGSFRVSQYESVITGLGTSVEVVSGGTDSKLVGFGVFSCWWPVNCKCTRLECVRVPFVKGKQQYQILREEYDISLSEL